MFTANILNPNATVNSYKQVTSIDFIPGDKIKLAFQIIDPNEDLRYIPPSTAIVTFSFNKTDGTTLEVQATLMADDRSMGNLIISAAQSADLYGGNFFFSIDNLGDGTSVDDGVIYNGLNKITIDS